MRGEIMNRLAIAIASVGLLGIVVAPSGRADDWNKKTTMTTDEAIQVPNMVLPAGSTILGT